MEGRYISKALAANVTAVEASAAIEVKEMRDVVVHVMQKVDNGTVTLKIEKSYDGINWSETHADITDLDFAAGADVGLERAFDLSVNPEDSALRYLRLRASAHTGTGEYTMIIGGRVRPGFGV